MHGDWLWLLKRPKTDAYKAIQAKFSPRYNGPFFVLDQPVDLTVKIMRHDKGDRDETVHVSRTKPFYPALVTTKDLPSISSRKTRERKQTNKDLKWLPQEDPDSSDYEELDPPDSDVLPFPGRVGSDQLAGAEPPAVESEDEEEVDTSVDINEPVSARTRNIATRRPVAAMAGDWYEPGREPPFSDGPHGSVYMNPAMEFLLHATTQFQAIMPTVNRTAQEFRKLPAVVQDSGDMVTESLKGLIDDLGNAAKHIAELDPWAREDPVCCNPLTLPGPVEIQDSFIKANKVLGTVEVVVLTPKLKDFENSPD